MKTFRTLLSLALLISVGNLTLVPAAEPASCCCCQPAVPVDPCAPAAPKADPCGCSMDAQTPVAPDVLLSFTDFSPVLFTQAVLTAPQSASTRILEFSSHPDIHPDLHGPPGLRAPPATLLIAA